MGGLTYAPSQLHGGQKDLEFETVPELREKCEVGRSTVSELET
jgi:hypothetical protein